MCGLVGIFDSRDKRAIDAALLRRMNDSISHRGPDGDGLHTGPGIGLGHRRLSIIDLGGGAQPMYDPAEDIALVYNGEIYNYKDLTRELEGLGYTFRTSSDTECIIHGWDAWGPDVVKKLRGMFAIALFDRRSDTLFLSRDRLGKKPMYYAELADGMVLFGSELKALLRHPDLPRELDPTAVED